MANSKRQSNFITTGVKILKKNPKSRFNDFKLFFVPMHSLYAIKSRKNIDKVFFCSVIKTNDGGDGALNKLIHLMDKSTFTKTEFRRSEDIYRNRIRNDIKDLDVLSSDEVKSGYHYLYSRSEL